MYKDRGRFRRLGHLARAHGFVVRDATRVKNRLKSVYRSRGVWPGKGRSVYGKGEKALLAEARKHREWHVLTVIGRAEDEPLYHHYERLLDGGTKPNLAKLTLARQIAAIALAVWRSGEAYDLKKLGATE